MTNIHKDSNVIRTPELSSDFFAGNRRRLQKQFFAEHPEATCVVIAGNHLMQASADISHPFEQDSHFYYLTGLREAGLQLVLTPDAAFLITPLHDEIRSAFDGAVNPNTLTERSGIHDILTEETGWQRVQELCKRSPKAPVGILEPIDAYIPRLLMFTGLSRGFIKQRLADECDVTAWVDVRMDIARLRSIKQPEEVVQIQAAIDHTAAAFALLKDTIGSTRNERDLMAVFTNYKILHDLAFAYDPIIAAGGNAVILHYTANNMPLRNDDLVLMDLGLRVDGYNADITRTWPVRQVTERKQAVYDAVVRLQEAAIAKIRPGVVPNDYEKEMEVLTGEELIKLGLISDPTKEAIRQYLPHRVSHFLGIDVHDVGDYEQPLQQNMVMTVEPGIYIPEEGIGVRIEDDVLVTKTGSKLLSKELPR